MNVLFDEIIKFCRAKSNARISISIEIIKDKDEENKTFVNY